MNQLSNHIFELYMKVLDKIHFEHWRHYHDIQHINDVMGNTESLVRQLFAIFHDACYEIDSTTNEEASCIYMEEMTKWVINTDIRDTVHRLIMLSKHEYEHYTDLTKSDWNIIKHDLNVFLNKNSDIYNTELSVFKEYQKYDWVEYKQGRIKVLNSFKTKLDGLDHNIDERIKFLETFVPKIGIFAGSFNPFHIGHENILKKASKIFDKVIVAFGKNTEKNTTPENINIPKLKYHQVESYDGLLTDYVKSKTYPVTIIRGLRNGMDLNYELNLANVLRDVNNNVPLDIVYLTCDREYEYISSSVIRELQKFNTNLYV